MSLANLLESNGKSDLWLDRSSLKEQSTTLLRSAIINGRIPPGTKLVERELATLLGISRMPARDALMDLEREGLVVSKSNGRYVIELTRIDIEQLFDVRLELEGLAVRQAAANISPSNCAALRASLSEMQAAIASSDQQAYIESDVKAHQLIWRQANNPHLLRLLNSIVGPIFMFIASQTEFQLDWHETYQLHVDLTEALCAGSFDRAMESIEAHLQNSRQLSYRVFDS